jgi:hypothetical protein
MVADRSFSGERGTQLMSVVLRTCARKLFMESVALVTLVSAFDAGVEQGDPVAR